jgi:Aspartyl protease
VRRTIAAAVAVLWCGLAGVCAGAEPAGPVTVPYRFIDHRIMVDCVIDGQGPFSMILDTGAAGIAVTPDVARRLHLRSGRAGAVGGAGSGETQAAPTTLSSIAAGSFVLRHVAALVLDLGPIRRQFGFPQLDGILGYDAFRGRRTFIDADHQTVTFAVGAMPVPAGARAVPFTYVDGLVHVGATIDGLAGRVVVDTGDRSSFTLFGPFARRHGLYRRYRAQRNVMTGIGLGGPIYSDVFRVPSLALFGYRLHAVVTRASRDRGGAFEMSSDAGSVGSNVLRRFNVVYDDVRRVITAWPSAAFSSPDVYVPLLAHGRRAAHS